jgi:glutamyl-tRNA synthetase
MSDLPVRVRVAPSPTGDPHVGTAYQALFNFAFARHHSGRFILRIEDTDQARSRPQHEQAILEALRWLGLSWDEGPDVGGPHAPYRQSERLAIYRRHVELLLESGHAYRCFCTKDRLDRIRMENQANKLFAGYDRYCRSIPPTESRRRAEAGEPNVIRMKVPLEGMCVMQDLLRGEIQKEWAIVDDQVLLKSDGFPTYHLANVVDDHLMEISHVIRGEEWINSVPKHLLLYEYFGWNPPVFCHLPLLRNSDATRSKLSKRKNPTSINYYRRAGYLPAAVVNFLGLIGGSGTEGDEKFALGDFVQQFRIENVSLGGPVFDIQKLRWLNGRYIREDHDAAQLRGALENWALGREMLERIVPLVQPRMETLSDWGRLTLSFFTDEVACDPVKLQIQGKTQEECLATLQIVLWRMEQLPDFRTEAIEEAFRVAAERSGIKLRELTKLFYAALTGDVVGPPLFQSMEIFGPDLVRMRLRRAIQSLGGISGKKQKGIEQLYELWFGARE